MGKKMRKRSVGCVFILGLIFLVGISFKARFAAETSIVEEHVKGTVIPSIDSMKYIETEEDLNWDVEKVSMKIADHTIQLEIPVDEEPISFDLDMYPSKMGNDSENRMIGIEVGKSSDRYSILRFIVEKEANYMYLLKPNMDFLGKTVISLGFIDHETGAVYIAQFPVDQLNYDEVYAKTSNGKYSDDELLDQELAYFSWEIPSESETSSSDVETVTGGGSHTVSIDDQ